MRLNKNYWLTASGTLAVAGAIMLFSAHRIEAQFSSPVRVLNTSSAPAIASLIDDPGRTPYQSNQLISVSPTNFVAITFPAVPANHRLVVQHVSGSYVMMAAGAPTRAGLATSTGFEIADFITPSISVFNVFDNPVLAYFDAGQQPQTFAVSEASAPTYNGLASATLTGYLIDCSAAPCAPIAH